jgi:hypothetical protein
VYSIHADLLLDVTLLRKASSLVRTGPSPFERLRKSRCGPLRLIDWSLWARGEPLEPAASRGLAPKVGLTAALLRTIGWGKVAAFDGVVQPPSAASAEGLADRPPAQKRIEVVDHGCSSR